VCFQMYKFMSLSIVQCACMHVCVRACACVRAQCVRAYMFACVRSCVRVRACMCACILVLACVCVRECVHLCSYSEFGPLIGVREVSSHFVHLFHELLALHFA